MAVAKLRDCWTTKNPRAECPLRMACSMAVAAADPGGGCSTERKP